MLDAVLNLNVGIVRGTSVLQDARSPRALQEQTIVCPSPLP